MCKNNGGFTVLECQQVLSPTYFLMYVVWWWEYFVWC